MLVHAAALTEFREIADSDEDFACQSIRGAQSAPSYPVTTDFYRSVYCILGLPVDAITINEAAAKIKEAADSGRRCFLSTPNLNFLIGSLGDAGFRDSVIRSDLSVADGMPLVWIARMTGIPIQERVAGSTLFEHIGKKAESSMSVYFFGGPDGAASQAAEFVNSAFAGLSCVGAHSPGFGTIEEMSHNDTIRSINESRADFLVVALGARKGQAWIERNLYRLNVPVVSHLGAVVNIVAGHISRAPTLMQMLGLEWIWRIKEEPALWRRYFSDGLGLLKIFATRVVPYLLYAKRTKISAEDLKRAQVKIVRSDDVCNLVLSGAWAEENLNPLRQTLTDATRVPCDIIVDLKNVTHIDSACVALFILLYGHQSKVLRRLRFIHINPTIRRLLKILCVDYLAGTESGA